MIVFRISSKLCSQYLSGGGAKLFGARWNSTGIPMLYTSEYISLCLVEMLVHTRFKDFSVDLDLVDIYIPDDIDSVEISANKLKDNWVDDSDFSRYMGDEFIQSKKSLVLKVPSAVVPDEYNFLINPLHDHFKFVGIKKVRTLRTDKRLFTS